MQPLDQKVLEMIANAQSQAQLTPTIMEMAEELGATKGTIRWCLERLCRRHLLEHHHRKARTYRIPRDNFTTFEDTSYYIVSITKGKP